MKMLGSFSIPRRLSLPVLAVTVRRLGEPQCFSPVHAGVEGTSESRTTARQRQPRARGGRGGGRTDTLPAHQSAPRMRGSRGGVSACTGSSVVSPAYAGVEGSGRPSVPGTLCQPRVCRG